VSGYGGAFAPVPAATTVADLDAGFASVVTDDPYTLGKRLKIKGPLALAPGTVASAIRYVEHIGHGNAQSLLRVDAPEIEDTIFRVQFFAGMGSTGLLASNSIDIYDGEGPTSAIRHRIEGKVKDPTYFCAGGLGQFIVGAAGTLHSSAIAGVISTDRGFLPPKMTTAQRDAIVSPTPGLLLYNTDTGKLTYRNNASAWVEV
jgi:hypothetical protein